MGRKSVSNRKQNKSRPFSNSDIIGYSNARSGGHLLIQTLVRDKGALLYIDGMHPPAGSIKKNRNGENHILQQLPMSPLAIGLEERLLWEQLLANDSLGG